ncbi:MAG: hypothetical protein RRZ33_09795, partial [Lachnospiraceae bacterium]
MSKGKKKRNPGKIVTYQEQRERVQKFDLTSDIFFSKVLEGKEACQEVIQIILHRKDLKVKTVKSQYSIRNIPGHSGILDILAEDMEG